MTKNPEIPNDPEFDEKPSEDFAQALAAYETEARPAAAATDATRELAVGDKVRGRVISIGHDVLLVDYGGRSEGAVETRAYRNEDGTMRVAVGDDLELFVTSAGEPVTLASSMRTDPRAALGSLREAHAAKVPVSGRVTGTNTGGLTVEIGSVRGFCPVSHIESGFCADPSVYVGRTLEFLVTAVEEGRGSVVLSRRAVLRRVEEEQATQALSTLKPGDERDGVIARLEPFGAFINIGGLDGLAHVSEISWTRVSHPGDVVQVGQKVRVKVLRIEQGKDGRPRVALSLKAAAPDPWIEGVTQFSPGQKVTGKVARLADFGAFVTLAPGIDGLVHVSQIALQRINHPKDVLSVGQEIEAAILAVEPDKKRISLSMRELLSAGLPPTEVRVSAPSERSERSDRGGRGSRPGGGGGGGGRGDRGSRPPREPREEWSMPVKPEGPPEPTTMALALRKAMEDAAKKKAN